MNSKTSVYTTSRVVKAAGWLYFLIIFTSILSLVFLSGPYTVLGDSAASVMKMPQHEMSVRINAVYETVMFSAVIILAVLLFEITKSINSVLARSAMFLRTGEAILGYSGVVLTLAILLLQGNGTDQTLAILLYDMKDTIYKVLMVCISTGTIFYFYLFYKARLIPTILSIWGILGFGLMLCAGLLQMLKISEGEILNMIAAALVIPFELVVGIFLIVKGVKKEAQ